MPQDNLDTAGGEYSPKALRERYSKEITGKSNPPYVEEYMNQSSSALGGLIGKTLDTTSLDTGRLYKQKSEDFASKVAASNIKEQTRVTKKYGYPDRKK